MEGGKEGRFVVRNALPSLPNPKKEYCHPERSEGSYTMNKPVVIESLCADSQRNENEVKSSTLFRH